MNNLYNYFENLYKNNLISHAYLIGNTKLDLIKKEIYKILSDFFFHNNVNENCPDLYILDSSEENISKDQIKELIEKVSITSQFNDIKVYIINNCEKMSDSVYNAILKTLEEPGNNVFAILITENINQVKDTISSRCQKIFISNDKYDIDFDENEIEIGNKLIKSIEEKNIKTIAYYNNIYTEIDSRESLSKILRYIQNKYYNCINSEAKDEISTIIMEKNTIEEIANKILKINDNINMLKYFLNKNLSIDRFIIEMWRSKYEDSRN